MPELPVESAQVRQESPLRAIRHSRTRRLRVMFVGFESFWMQVLVNGLSTRYADILDCSWLQWPSAWPERARFVLAMLRTDLVVRVGMPFEFRSETNRLWLHWVVRSRRVRGVNYWIGQDALIYRDRSSSGDRTKDEDLALAALAHFASTENVAALLRSFGVPARTVVFPSPDREVPREPPSLPDAFRVLLYWADGKWEYSGGVQLIEAARRLSDVSFDVVGATGGDVVGPPPNVTFHGRVSDMESMYARCVVVVRVPVWDAVPGAMVEEAMIFARHVIYSFEFPHTIHVPHGDAEGLVAALGGLRDSYARGELGLNMAGREYMIEAWEPDARWARMCDELLRAHERNTPGGARPPG